MKEYFGKPIKKLGFGFMRLPTYPGKPESEIDIEEVKKMVDLYMGRGFSYYDSAFRYHGGKSEEAIRLTVTERYDRDKFQITTKLPVMGTTTLDEMKSMTQTSLDRAGLDFFDLYFIHGVGHGRIEMLDEIGAWNYLKSVKESGKSKNIGFSFHGSADTLNRILDAHHKDIDIVQLQINYVDWEDDDVQGRKCYEACVAHGTGIIIMEPVRGGALANFTPEVAGIFKKANPSMSLASWALRWTLGLENVVNVLSGMSTIEQVDDNTTVADPFTPLSGDEQKVIDNVMAELKKIPTIPCTECRYCVNDCPQKISIPGILNQMNEYTLYQNLDGARRIYGFITSGWGPFGGSPAKASDCVACGLCEANCPQKIGIVDCLKEAVKLFE